MKVYFVTAYHEYKCSSLYDYTLGVYASREIAEQHITKKKEDDEDAENYDFKIREYDVISY